MSLVLPNAGGKIQSHAAAATRIEEAVELAIETEEVVAGTWSAQTDAITDEDLLKIDQLILEEFWSMEMLSVQSQLQGQFGSIIGGGPKANNDWIMAAPGVPTTKKNQRQTERSAAATANSPPTQQQQQQQQQQQRTPSKKRLSSSNGSNKSQSQESRSGGGVGVGVGVGVGDTTSTNTQQQQTSAQTSTAPSTQRKWQTLTIFNVLRRSTRSSNGSSSSATPTSTATPTAAAAAAARTGPPIPPPPLTPEQMQASRPFDAENTAYGLSPGRSDPQHDENIINYIAEILLTQISNARRLKLNVNNAYIHRGLVRQIAYDLLVQTDLDPGGARQVHITINLQRVNQEAPIQLSQFQINRHLAPMIYFELTLYEHVSSWFNVVPKFIINYNSNKALYVDENYKLIKSKVMFPTDGPQRS